LKEEELVYVLSNTEKIAAIIRKAPNMYQVTILGLLYNAKRISNDPNAEPTLKELRKGLNDLYIATTDYSKDREVSMITDGGGNHDSGRKRTAYRTNKKCYPCGKKGHLKRDGKEKNTKSTSKCSHCGKKGHGENECWWAK